MRRELGIGRGQSAAAHLVLQTSRRTLARRLPEEAPTLAFAVTPAFAFALAAACLRLEASRAPQTDAAAEAPLSERSEFGRRAASGEEHRAPMRLHRIGECPAQTVLATFAKTKVARASARLSTAKPVKLLPLTLLLPLLLPSASASALKIQLEQ